MDRNMKIMFRITTFLYLIINWKVQAFDSSRCPRMVFQIFDGYAPMGLYFFIMWNFFEKNLNIQKK